MESATSPLSNGRRRPLIARFLRRIRLSLEEDGCWEVLDEYLQSDGYGRAIRCDDPNLKISMAQAAWHFGHYPEPFPEGLQADHLCRNRRCARWDHIEPVTREENIRRAVLARKQTEQKDS